MMLPLFVGSRIGTKTKLDITAVNTVMAQKLTWGGYRIFASSYDRAISMKPNTQRWNAFSVKYLTLLSLLIILYAEPCWGGEPQGNPQLGLQKPATLGVEPVEAIRGTPIRMTGMKFPAQRDSISFRLNEMTLGHPSSISPDSTSLVFRIPDGRPVSFPLGRYSVFLEPISKNRIAIIFMSDIKNGQLQIVSNAGETVKITAIHQSVSPDDSTLSFTVLGEGFSEVPTDNVLVIQNQDVPVAWNGTRSMHNKPYGAFVSSRELTFWGIPRNKYHEQIKLPVQVRVGNNTSEISDASSITTSSISKSELITGSMAVSAVLALILFALVWKGVGIYKVNGKPYNPFQAFFLDPETDTYSLSKFQFYVWTGAAVFGYVYLTLARIHLQGNWAFTPIPENLPGIIFISASTTIVAQGITRVKGPKGAGEVHPSFADFISTGGIVVAERFQFFVWTLLGAITFFYLIVQQNPATIQELPKISEGFLYLMGISSFGYLGGKFVRRAGPVIDGIVATTQTQPATPLPPPPPNLLTLEIHGRALSQNASFRIGDEEITPDMLEDKRPQLVEKDPQIQEADMAQYLRLVIKDPKPAWLPSPSNKCFLTLINSDGQKAVWPYEIK